MELSEDDVLHILKLIDESKFDYFQLEVGELKITVSKGEPIPNSAPRSWSRQPPRSRAGCAANPRRAGRCAAAAAKARSESRWPGCRSRPRFSGRFM